MTQNDGKALRVLDSIILWSAIILAVAIPLVFWPRVGLTSYPLIYIYLYPKAIVLRVGCYVLLGLLALRTTVALAKKRRAMTINWADISFAGFFGLLWLSTRHAIDGSQAWYGSVYWVEGFYTYLNYAVIFLAARALGSAEWLKKLAYPLIVSTIFIAAYAVYEAFHPEIQGFTRVGFAGRSGATAGNAVILGAYLILPLALIATLLAQKTLKGAWARAALLAVGLGISATAFTFSRGTWTALALVCLVLVWSAWREGRRFSPIEQVLAVSVLVVALGFIAIGPKSPQLIARAFSIFNPSEPTAASRLVAWRQAAKVALKYPLWGTGIDNFAAGVGATPPEQFSGAEKPHNFPLEILSTMGAPAFLAYAGWLALLFYGGIQTLRGQNSGSQPILELRTGPKAPDAFSPPLLAGLLAIGGYLVALFFLFSTVNNSPLFYLIAGLTAGGADKAGMIPRVRLDRPAGFLLAAGRNLKTALDKLSNSAIDDRVV